MGGRVKPSVSSGQSKTRTVVEYALRNMQRPLDIATYIMPPATALQL